MNFNKLKKVVKNKEMCLVSLGCRTNQSEVVDLAAKLQKNAKKLKINNKVFLINTCAVTQKAVGESKRLINKIKKDHPKSTVIALGCGATLNPQLFNKADYLINNLQKQALIKNSTDISETNKKHSFAKSKRILIRVQTGCNNFCSYCIVPYLRKKIISESPKNIITKIKKAEKLGYKEITLTGTNLELYKYKNCNFSDLVEKVLKKTTIPRIGFGSINLEAIDNKLIRLFENEWSKKGTKRLNRYLHIPLQSGSDKILRKMNRRYTTSKFSKKLKKISKRIRNIGIGTDIIVGFPGETNSDFKKTVDFLLKHSFTKLHVFRFSPRPNTVLKNTDTISVAVKKARAKKLRLVGIEKAAVFRNKQLGKKLSVLFLEKKNNKWHGISDNYIPITKKSEKNLTGVIRKITF